MGKELKLGSLAAIAEKEEEGTWVDITHPSGDPLCMGGKDKPLRIKIAGAYSKTARAVIKRHRDETWKRGGKLDGDDIDRRELSALAACTLEWEHAYDDDGKPIPLDRDNARVVYDAAPFIVDQVNAASADHARFFSNASETP